MEKGIQEHYQAAMKFAGEAHAFQEVPGTKDANYLLHVSNVAMEVLVAHAAEPTFDLALAVQMAALHDTVEDTKTTIEDISKTFGPHVAEGVAALTKNKSESSNENVLADSLTRIKNTSGPEAAIVKLADRVPVSSGNFRHRRFRGVWIVFCVEIPLSRLLRVRGREREQAVQTIVSAIGYS